MKITREFKTGVIALVAIGVMIWGYNYLKKQSLFDSTRTFYTEFDNVQGLSTSSVVSINGLEVGSVSSIKFNPKKRGTFIVSYSLTNNFSFSKKSQAKIIPAEFIGESELHIIPSYEGEEAKSGDYLVGSIEQGLVTSLGSKLEPMNKKLNEVLVNIDELLNNLNNTLDANTQNNIKASIANLNTSLNSFKSASKSLDELLAENKTKFSTIMDNASETSDNLKSVTQSLEENDLTKDLKQTVTKLNTTLTNFESILAQVDKGDGTIGKLLKDEGLYTNLENATKEMEELLREMKLHPKRFVHFSLFGRKDKTGYVKDTTK